MAGKRHGKRPAKWYSDGSWAHTREPTSAEYIAARLLEDNRATRKPKAPKTVTLRRFSWEPSPSPSNDVSGNDPNG